MLYEEFIILKDKRRELNYIKKIMSHSKERKKMCIPTGSYSRSLTRDTCKKSWERAILQFSKH